MLGSLHPAGLAQLAVANIFGSHQIDYWGPNVSTEPLVALTDDSFNYLFVGAVPVILLLWFGIAGGGVFRRGRTLIAATAALALVYALGRYTPVFAWAFDWVPGVSRFRRPVDGSFVFVAMLALMCGALLADYIREGVPRGRLLASLAAALVAHCRGRRRRDLLRSRRPFRRCALGRADERADRRGGDPDAGARARQRACAVSRRSR